MNAKQAAEEIIALMQVDGEVTIDTSVLTEIIQGDLDASGKEITPWICTHIVSGSLPEEHVTSFRDTWDYISLLG